MSEYKAAFGYGANVIRIWAAEKGEHVMKIRIGLAASALFALMLQPPTVQAQSSNWGNEGNQLAATYKRTSSYTDIFGVMCHNDGTAYVTLMSTGRQIPVGATVLGTEALAVHWSMDQGPLSDQQTWWLMKHRGVFSLRRSGRNDAGTAELIKLLRSGNSLRIRVLDPGDGDRVVIDEQFSLAGSNRAIARLPCV